MTDRLDWEQARRKLDDARLALVDDTTPDDERAVLVERARVLALPLADADDDGEWRDVVVFTLCGERFAVAGEHVLEAVPIGSPTPVPGTPAPLLGVVNHRGRVLAVIDLSEQLVAGGMSDGELTHAIAVEVDGMRFAIAAEAVEETSRERAGTLDHGLMTVLDLEALAADPRLRVDDA